MTPDEQGARLEVGIADDPLVDIRVTFNRGMTWHGSELLWLSVYLLRICRSEICSREIHGFGQGWSTDPLLISFDD